MYQLYSFATPNSVKVSIALEELGQEYVLHAVNIRKGEQKLPSFLAMNPNAKVPVLVDPAPSDRQGDGAELILSESAAILVYLAEKHDALLPRTGAARARVFAQLFFHASAVSPALGQSGFFQKLAAEPQPIALERFSNEVNRTLGLLDTILASNAYIAGDEYSIADIAHFGWLWRRAFANVDLQSFPNIDRWYTTVSQRPAVVKAITRLEAIAAV